MVRLNLLGVGFRSPAIVEDALAKLREPSGSTITSVRRPVELHGGLTTQPRLVRAALDMGYLTCWNELDDKPFATGARRAVLLDLFTIRKSILDDEEELRSTVLQPHVLEADPWTGFTRKTLGFTLTLPAETPPIVTNPT